MTACDLLVEAPRRGLTVTLRGDQLAIRPPRLLTPDFADLLRAHKPDLLALLRLPFVMVFSKALEETIFFCQDEATRAALVEAGASEWSVYTRGELQVLVAQNRIAPFSDAELRKVHEIKRTFNTKIAK
jgi:hypothetical protein